MSGWVKDFLAIAIIDAFIIGTWVALDRRGGR